MSKSLYAQTVGMPDTRLSMSACCQGLFGGVTAQERGWGEGGPWQWFTISTNADFEHPGAETISSWHAETLISGVFFGIHEDITRGCKSVRLNAFHLYVFHIGKMDWPEMTEEAENNHYVPYFAQYRGTE